MTLEHTAPQRDCVLVTGSNGFIGSKVVEILLEYGFVNLRCFARSSSRIGRLENALNRFQAAKNVEVVTGDLLSRDDCRKAAAGVSIIYHLAAGMEKSFAGAFMNSALATRNLMDAFLRYGRPRRFVNVSSFAVYSNLGLKRDDILDETCALENAPQKRFDAYGFGKLKQEELVREYGEKYGLRYVILRPGYVFGPGKTELNGRVAINTFGFLTQVGVSYLLPLTFVDNCAEAIVLAGLKSGIDGEVFNVVDDELLTSKQFLRLYKFKVERFSIRIPYVAAYGLCLLWERYAEWSKGQLPAVFNRRRCAAEWKGNRYSNQKLHERLGWKPRVNMEKAMAAFLAQFGKSEDRDRRSKEVRAKTTRDSGPKSAVRSCIERK
jgi:nucleoside-diphosphate-sugar epimerase